MGTVYTHLGKGLQILHYLPQSPLGKGGSSSSPPYQGGVRGGEAIVNASFEYLYIHGRSLWVTIKKRQQNATKGSQLR